MEHQTRGSWQIVQGTKQFTKTLQTPHFVQSQRPVDDPVIDAVAIASSDGDAVEE
jgi:hypothetical protein